MTRPRDRFGRPLPEGSPDELRGGPPPSSVEEALRRGAELFDLRRFFEAHESFEWAWKSPEVDEQDRPFFKGLAQVAVGCCHIQRGNPAGAARLLARGAQSLKTCPSPHHGIDTADLAASAVDLGRTVGREGICAEPGFPSLSHRES